MREYRLHSRGPKIIIGENQRHRQMINHIYSQSSKVKPNDPSGGKEQLGAFF